MKLLKTIMIHLTIIITIFLLIMLFYHKSIPEIESDDHYLDQIDTNIHEMMKRYDIAGVQLTTFDQTSINHKNYGFLDLENQIEITSDTIFRAQSLSKTLTAVLILRLVQDDVIDLDDQLKDLLDASFINQIPDHYKEVTVHQILKHQAHMPLGDFNRMYDISDSNIMSLEEALIIDLNKPSASSTFFYSNVGYNLLEYIIDQITIEGYQAYAKTIIFDPLNMKDTSFSYDDFDINRFAYGYDQFKDKISHYQYPELGSGGLLTTSNDYTLFLKALVNKEIIDQDHLESMFNYNESVGLGSYGLVFDGYGYGVFIEDDGQDLTFAHGGQGLGFMAFFHMNLENQSGYVVMSNSQRTYPLISSLSTMFHDNYDYEIPGIKNIHFLMIMFKVLLASTIYLIGLIGFAIYQKKYIKNKVLLSGLWLFVLGLGFLIIYFYLENYLFIHVLIPLDFERLMVIGVGLEIFLLIYLLSSIILKNEMK